MLRQVTASVYFSVFGFAAAAGYDILKFLRALLGISSPELHRNAQFLRLPQVQMFPETIPRKILISIIDFLYFAVLGAAASVFLFYVNSGILRWYFVASAIAGFALYRVSLSLIILPLFSAFAHLLHIAFKTLARLIIKPIKGAANFTVKIIKGAASPIVRKAKRKRSIRYTRSIIRALPSLVVPKIKDL